MVSITHQSGTAATRHARWRCWRTPPNWSPFDWRQEAGAEAAAAACEALRQYDATLGIPLDPFVAQRVLAGVLTRYRREWRYALRTAPFPVDLEEDEALLALPGEPPILDTLRCAVGGLPLQDQDLLHELFWEGRKESDVAATLGVTQQAVSKHKGRVLEALRARMDGE